MRDVERFSLMVSSKVLPHDHYSLLAYRLGISMMNTTSKISVKRNHSLPTVMRLKKINAFARSCNLTERQSLHIDGEELGLTVIVVYSCGSDGYPIYYVPKSHNLMNKHVVSTPIPSSAVLRVTAQKGDVIIFADSLIHGGGESSMPTNTSHDELCNILGSCGKANNITFHAGKQKENNENLHGGETKESTWEMYKGWFGSGSNFGEQPSDVSLQYSFSHNGSSSAMPVGLGRNIWYEVDDCKLSKKVTFDRYIDTGKRNFHDSLRCAERQWVTNLAPNQKRLIRGRQCKDK